MSTPTPDNDIDEIGVILIRLVMTSAPGVYSHAELVKLLAPGAATFLNNAKSALTRNREVYALRARINELEHVYGCDGERYTYSDYNGEETTLAERLTVLRAELATLEGTQP